MPSNSGSDGDKKTVFECNHIADCGSLSFSGRMNTAALFTPSGQPPLVIAIHGGTYSSAYFDVPGYSLLAAGDRFGLPVIAVDRPSYGYSTPLQPNESTIEHNAEILVKALGKIWDARAGSTSGIVLVGHSIGGATVISMAASKPSWPLLGIAISGVGLSVTPGDDARWAALPEGLVSLPDQTKDIVMFGPEGSYRRDMPAASHVANTTCPRAELIDITGNWPRVVRDVAAKVDVPVHYRQAEFDRLWIVNNEQVSGFAKAFISSPSVDARMVPNAGHCIDFHSAASQLHEEQLNFAVQCSKRRR